MASELIKSYRNDTEIYQGEALCKQKFHERWEELCLPKASYDQTLWRQGTTDLSGFVSLKQEHRFRNIGKTIVYDPELTMFVEKGRIKKLGGCANMDMFFQILPDLCF